MNENVSTQFYFTAVWPVKLNLTVLLLKAKNKPMNELYHSPGFRLFNSTLSNCLPRVAGPGDICYQNATQAAEHGTFKEPIWPICRFIILFGDNSKVTKHNVCLLLYVAMVLAETKRRGSAVLLLYPSFPSKAD